MADRGITFSAAMVRALLDGRKTQTRRLATFVMPQSNGDWHCRGNGGGMMGMDDALVREWGWSYAPRQTGDRLYVREHWKVWQSEDAVAPRDMPPGRLPIHYLADLPAPFDPFLGRHRQAMHMPRWASRLTLLVTDVRVQRLQNISEADAIAEGVIKEWVIVGANCNGGIHSEDWDWRYWHGAGDEPDEGFESATEAYAALWDSLHTDLGTRWEDNPWIVATSFTVKHGNIDNLEGAN